MNIPFRIQPKLRWQQICGHRCFSSRKFDGGGGEDDDNNFWSWTTATNESTTMDSRWKPPPEMSKIIISILLLSLILCQQTTFVYSASSSSNHHHHHFHRINNAHDLHPAKAHHPSLANPTNHLVVPNARPSHKRRDTTTAAAAAAAAATQTATVTIANNNNNSKVQVGSNHTAAAAVIGLETNQAGVAAAHVASSSSVATANGNHQDDETQQPPPQPATGVTAAAVALAAAPPASSSLTMAHTQSLKSYTTSNKSINFTHIELDTITGNIYVGASNWIFQLDSVTLRVEHAVRTGPIRDSPVCPPSDCSGVDSQSIQVTNNINKVLLVEPYARMLIVCGSVHQGACTRHRLEDISQHEDLVPIPVAANDENSSTVAFVGPARYFGVQLTPILYVAATDTRLGPYRDMVPAIAGRSLESSRLFQIIDRGFADSARVDISSNLRDYFTVHYVYGFYANDYVYFAQVQRRSYLRTLEEMGYTSRLSRVCVSDAGFHTYTELTLECVYEGSGAGLRDGPGGRFRARYHGNNNDDDDDDGRGGHQSDSKITEHFNLLQDAIVIKAGADLSDSLNIERGSLVLIGVFSNSFDHTNRPGDKSALCVYPINDIEQRFAENIHLCYNGSVFSRNMDYIAGSVNQCPEPGAGNVYNFCNEAVKLNGSIPLRSQASIVYRSGTVLTAVAAGVTGQHTVAFIGTDYGSIKKILLSRGDYGQQFDEVSIDLNNPILADLFVDNDQNPKYLIASSPYKVVKFPVEFCVQHKSCDQCLQARNPYCGWCSLQKRCTIKSDCLLHHSSSSTSTSATGGAGPDGPTNGGVDSSGVYHYPNQNQQHHHHHYHHHHLGGGAPTSPSISPLFSTPRWLSLETSQCIDFQAIKPEYIPRNLLAPVELIINQLPPLPYGANYLCVFENGTPIPATVTRNGLACQTPNISSRPAIPLGQDHINVNVAVRSSETDTDFIHRSFIFFDCSVHKSCKSCVMSAWDCNWCMHENLCTYNTSLCTRRVIVGENSPQNSLIKGVQHCPSFNIDQEILIPNGSRRELSVEVRNLIPSQDGFQCIVEIEQAKERVSARVQDNNIICNDMMLSYQDEIGQQRASLTVLWNSDTFIDRTNFTIYKCEFLGAYAGRADCSLCQTRDTKYGCVWCQNQCQFVDHCQQMPVNTCPPPRIDYIHPISGPVEGGTLVSIEGSNLGSSLDEIKDRVSIGGIPCQPTQYNISIRVICRTGPSIIGPQSALVVIGNRAGVTRAQEKFQYKIIELTDVNPKIGPQSGGTRIYLSGKNLNIGSNVAVYLDDLPCFVERALASSFQMSCRTSPAPYASYVVNRLILMVDGANFTLINPFLYTPDPTIERIEPLQSFFSGGRIITITGTQFTSIQQPRMLVFVPRSPLHHHLPVHHHHLNNNNNQRPAPNNHNNNNNHHHYHHYSSTWPSAYSLKQSNGGNPTTTMMMMTMMMMDGLPSPTTTTTTMSTYNGFRIDQNRLINESICTVLSPIKMQCHSPMINGDLQLLASMLGQANNNNLDQQQQSQPQPQPMAANNNNNNSTLHHIPNQIYLQIGFIMDGTLATLELDQYYPHLDSTMLYVSDPIIYSLNNGHGKSIVVGRHNAEDSVLPFKGDVLVIEGENLAVLLLSENELNVTVGTKRCNLTSVTMRQIICQPPVYPPPPPTDELGRRGPIDLPSVVLKIGNMRKHLGYLHYGDYFYGYNPMDPYATGPNGAGGGGVGDDSSRFYHHNPAFGYGGAQGNGGGAGGPGGNRFEPVTTINVELLIVVSIVIGTILTIISVIILAAYKHKTTQAEREYKRIQLQMDTLENNVRSECKQAFAELQTDILQANGLFNMDDLPRISLPTHDERTFLLRMFVSTGMLSNQNNNNTPGYLEDNGGGGNNGQLQQLQHSLKSQNLYQMFWFWSPYFTINDDDNGRLSAPPLTTTTTTNHHQTPPIIHLNPMFKDLHHHHNNNHVVQNNNNNNYPENFYTLNQRQQLQYGPMTGVGGGGGFPDENVILTAGQRPSIVIEQFEQLILNRTFLLILVDTLEQQQKTFQYADRMRFASLLMLTLLDRMEYSFDVMRHLLSRLLDRFAAMKNSNQLIRKQETIVEKIMIDWLTICLHKYAKEISSGPLFLLFSAIKHQIDKGPVDYVTGNSRYSLSEDKLLREQIDYKTLTVHVFLDEKLQQTQCKTERFSLTTTTNTNAASNNNTANATNTGGNAAPLAACNQMTQIRNRRRVSTLRNNTRTLLNKKQPLPQQPQTMLDTNHNEAAAANNYEVGGGATPEDVAGGSGGSSGGFTSVTGFGGDTQTTSSTDITDKDDDQATGIIGGVGGGGGNGTAGSHGTTTTTTTTTSSPNSGYPCRVLDCDTITQVKMKIIDQLYRCVPNAERPQVQELQLYWRCVRPKSNSLNPLAQAIKNHNNNNNNNNNTNNNNMADYNGTEASFNSDHSSSTPNHHHHGGIGSGGVKHNSVSTTTAFGGGGGAIQDVYGVASLMSKSDADKIYNASRRSDVSLEMADILLDDYDHSTQILTANEAIWRRLNTISHYGITDGAMFYLCSRPTNTKSSSSCYGDQNSLIYGANNNNNGGAKRLNHSIHSGGGAGGSYSGGGGGGPSTTIQNRTKPNDLSPSIRVPNDFINHAQSRYPYVASVGGGSGILNTNNGNTNSNNNDEMYGGDSDADNTEFHLYESIPADRQQQQQPPSMGVSDMSMGVGMGGGYTSRDSFYGSTAAMMMATMNGGTNVDSVYNLSNASSSAVRSRSQYPVASGNYTHHHHQQQRSLLLHQYEPFNYGRTTTTTTTISSPQQRSMMMGGGEDVLYPSIQNSNNNGNFPGTTRIYFGNNSFQASSPPTSLSSPPYQSTTTTGSTPMLANGHVVGGGQQRFLLNPATTNNNNHHHHRNNNNRLNPLTRHRSFARNVYDRLSMFMRGRTKQQSRPYHHYNGQKRFRNTTNHKKNGNRNPFSDYGMASDDMATAMMMATNENDHQQQPPEERHNIWHLVKPSSLIADCIIGASGGSFLYDNGDDGKRGPRYNLRTMRQRRALRRRRNKPSFAGFSHNHFNQHNNNGKLYNTTNTSATQLAAVASAALSASQMNLNQVGVLAGFGSGSVSMNSLAMAANNYHHHNNNGNNNSNNNSTIHTHHGSSRMVGGAGGGSTGGAGGSSSPLSLLTTSASTLFSNIFKTNANNNNNNNNNNLQDNNNQDTTGSNSNQQHALMNSSISAYLMNRSIPEIYLTRLLTTKGTIQQYVEDFFRTIFTVNERLPIAIKWLFDFFDQETMKNSLQNTGNTGNNDTNNSVNNETVLLWKNHSLIMRFWVTLLRMPEILFDVNSNVSIDVCLDVLAQNLVETCQKCLPDSGLNNGGGGQPKLSKDSPASKLLCARDIANYQQMIEQYYKDIQRLPAIKEGDIIAYMKDVSKTFEGKICKEKCLDQILGYCLQYKEAIFQSLAQDPQAQQEHLRMRFETIIYAAMATTSTATAHTTTVVQPPPPSAQHHQPTNIIDNPYGRGPQQQQQQQQQQYYPTSMMINTMINGSENGITRV